VAAALHHAERHRRRGARIAPVALLAARSGRTGGTPGPRAARRPRLALVSLGTPRPRPAPRARRSRGAPGARRARPAPNAPPPADAGRSIVAFVAFRTLEATAQRYGRQYDCGPGNRAHSPLLPVIWSTA